MAIIFPGPEGPQEITVGDQVLHSDLAKVTHCVATWQGCQVPAVYITNMSSGIQVAGQACTGAHFFLAII